MGGPKQRYITTYQLSPYEQRVCAGTLHRAVFNTWRRTIRQVPYVLPGVVFFFGYYTYGVRANEYDHSKAGMMEAGISH